MSCRVCLKCRLTTRGIISNGSVSPAPLFGNTEIITVVGNTKTSLESFSSLLIILLKLS